jgi:hypothetical protein
LLSRTPWPSRGYRTITVSTPTSFEDDVAAPQVDIELE